MSTLTYTDEPELLAAIQAKAEWADVPVVRIVAADTENFDGDPIKEVFVIIDDDPNNPISLESKTIDSRWNKLMEACRFATQWLLERDASLFPLVSYRHSWRLYNLFEAA